MIVATSNNWILETIPTILSIVSILIALVSLIYSALTYNANKARIKIINKNDPMKYNYMKYGTLKMISYDDPPKELYTFSRGILVVVEVLNPSPKDVAYFNLGFYVNGSYRPAITEMNLQGVSGVLEPHKYAYDINGISGTLTLIKDMNGQFKANSLTQVFTFLNTDQHGTFNLQETIPEVKLSFDYSIKGIFSLKDYSTKEIIIPPKVIAKSMPKVIR